MREGARDRVTRGHVMVYIINTTPRTRVKGSKDLRISGSQDHQKDSSSSNHRMLYLDFPINLTRTRKKKQRCHSSARLARSLFLRALKCECSRPHRQRQGVRFSPTSLIGIDEPGTCTTLYTRQQPSLLTQKKSSS